MGWIYEHHPAWMIPAATVAFALALVMLRTLVSRPFGGIPRLRFWGVAYPVSYVVLIRGLGMERRRISWSLPVVCLVALAALLVGVLVPLLQVSASPPNYLRPEFQPVWERADLPVEQGLTSRSWLWGPDLRQAESINVDPPAQEPFLESPGGMRTVQYFEKARMEWTSAGIDTGVTNGLLVVEMISGREQHGFDTFIDREPALQTPIGDPAEVNPTAPTYADFAPIASIGANIGANVAPDRTGQVVLGTLDGNGAQSSLGTSPDASVTYGVYDQNVTSIGLGHNLANKFWEYFQLSGPVYENGQVSNGQVIDWLFAMGLPLTEPYWVRAKVAGTEKWVLVQLFERRALTYTPDNPPGFQVEMANVGIHYYRWRYPQMPDPEPTPTVDTGTPTPSPSPSPSPSATPTEEPEPETIAMRVAHDTDKSLTTVTGATWTTLAGAPLVFPAEGYALVTGNGTVVDAGRCRIAVGHSNNLLTLPAMESVREFRMVNRFRQEISTSYLIGPLPAGEQFFAFMMQANPGGCTVGDRTVTAVYVPATSPSTAGFSDGSFNTSSTTFQVVASASISLPSSGMLLVSGGATAYPETGSSNACQIAIGRGSDADDASVKSYRLNDDSTALSDVSTTYLLGPLHAGHHEVSFLARSQDGTPCRFDDRTVTAVYAPHAQAAAASNAGPVESQGLNLVAPEAMLAVTTDTPHEEEGWWVVTGGASAIRPDGGYPTCRIGIGYSTTAGIQSSILDSWRGYNQLADYEQEVTTTYAAGPFTSGERDLYYQFAPDAAGQPCVQYEQSMAAVFVPLDWQGNPPSAGVID